MIFRQLFDSVSSTYTYLLASRVGGEALLIDPVFKIPNSLEGSIGKNIAVFWFRHD